MASTQQKREWWSTWRCNPDKMVGVEFPGWSTPLPVADESAPAWELFADLMRQHGYFFRESAGGTYNCRRINHNPANNWSLHAYGIALDLNPSANPPGDPDFLSTPQHDFPFAFIDDVLATGLFRWGWDWDEDGSSDDHSFIDPMHWEIDVPPDQIRNLLEDDMDISEIKTAVKEVLEEHDNVFAYTNSAGQTRRISGLSVNSTWHVDIAGKRAMDLVANLKDLPTADVEAIAVAVNDELARRVVG